MHMRGLPFKASEIDIAEVRAGDAPSEVMAGDTPSGVMELVKRSCSCHCFVAVIYCFFMWLKCF